jgi:ATP-dependent 26S proteasome regulatory subunit
MYAALRIAVRPTYRTRPGLPLSSLPRSSSRTFRATTIHNNKDSNSNDAAPTEQTSEVKEDETIKEEITEKKDEVVEASSSGDSPVWADKIKTSLGLEDKTPSLVTGGRLTSSRLRKAQRARLGVTSLKNELELPDWFTQRCVKLCVEAPPPARSAEWLGKAGFNAAPTPPPTTNVTISGNSFLEIAAITAGSFATVSAGGRNTFWGLKANLALYCAFDGGNTWLNSIVDHVARDQQADVLRLDAQDIMELGGAFVSPDAQDFLSLRTLGFDAFQTEAQEEMEDEMDKDDEEDDIGSGRTGDFAIVMPPDLPEEQKRIIIESVEAMKKSPFFSKDSPYTSAPKEKTIKKDRRTDNLDMPSSTPIDNRRLTAFWDTVIDRARAQRTAVNLQEQKLMICIEDFMGISGTAVGEELLESLATNVQRRRGEFGEKIMIVGTTSSSELAGDEDAQKELENESEGSFYRTILIAPDSTATPPPNFSSWAHYWMYNTRDRRASINFRNIYWMLKQIEPQVHNEGISPGAAFRITDPDSTLYDRVFKQEDAHRVALVTTGLRASELWKAYVEQDEERPSTATLIGAALSTTKRVKKPSPGKSDFPRPKIDGEVVKDLTKAAKFTGFPEGPMPWNEGVETTPAPAPEVDQELRKAAETKAHLASIRQQCNPFETKLFGGIVHPDSIKTTFEDVHVAKDTVDAVRTLTSLSLLRPDAFKYGVLSTDNISGLLLYGPPGTGKTLLAKAVAKESGATVLNVTGSDINQMYVGESEKVVKAMFSLARKLSPCVVFIDEADSILGSRSGGFGGNRGVHRETINQMLLEWDGLNSVGVFMMVATNRPFDLDDAVLRRLPRRVLVDLPTQKDRESILKIHLRDEQLDDAVSLSKLAEKTPYYSGSDLKNVSVSAAMACIKEENEAKKAAEEKGETDFKYAERRVLCERHFESALGEIAASISADMGSLKGIKRFDEKYGDRKGRKKKNAFGFLEEVKKEESARVRE